MKADFWQNLWETGQTRWDLGEISPPLKHYINLLSDKHIRVLIPGCGNAHEAAYMLENGFANMTVIDIAPAPVKALAERLSHFVEKGYLQVICGDFFDLSGAYDLILEQTFFCALLPEQRKAYAIKTHSLLAEGGVLAGLLFNRDFEDGPPFGGNAEEYITYFKPVYAKVDMQPCNTSAPPRAGTELWIELEK